MVRVVTLRRSTDDQTPMVPFFAVRSAPDLHAERVDAVAGEEVLAAAHVASALADRDEVEDRADVAEERIVALTGERLAAHGEGDDALRGERAVVRSRARPDVVRRGRPAGDDRRLPADDPRDRVRLRGVTEEERPVFVRNWNRYVTFGRASPFVST